MADRDQQAAYAITDEERFLFDLNGFVVRPGILEADEIAAIRDQIYRLRYDRDSLPSAERAILGGSSSVLIDHPAVLGIVKSVINSQVRIEHSYSVWRERGESYEAPFHRGGPKSIQADPIFGYRCDNGRIYAGMVRVVIELTDIDETNGGGTWFIPGSHKANCEIPVDFLEPNHADRMPGAIAALRAVQYFSQKTFAMPGPFGSATTHASRSYQLIHIWLLTGTSSTSRQPS